MRVGVIGLAGVGRTHINKWSEIAELVSVCDLDSTVLAQVTKSCQIRLYKCRAYVGPGRPASNQCLHTSEIPSFNHAAGRRPWNSCLVRKTDG